MPRKAPSPRSLMKFKSVGIVAPRLIHCLKTAELICGCVGNGHTGPTQTSVETKS